MKHETIQLTDAQAAFIQARIDAGDFANASEVIRAGLRMLADYQEDKAKREAELRRILDEAEAGGISPRSHEEIWADARARILRADA